MRDLGYGKDYRYAHDEARPTLRASATSRTGWSRREFYRPTERGLEAKIRERLEHLRELDRAGRARKK